MRSWALIRIITVLRRLGCLTVILLSVLIDLWSIQLNVFALMWNKIKFS